MPELPEPEGVGETSATIYKKRLLVAGTKTSNLWSYHLQIKNWTKITTFGQITGMGKSKNSLYLILGDENKLVEITGDETRIYNGEMPSGPIVNEMIENDEGTYGISKDGTVFQIEKSSKTSKIVKTL